MVINRLGSSVSLKTEATTDENASGEFLAQDLNRVDVGRTDRDTRVRRVGNELKIETEAAGRKYEKSVPCEVRVVGPHGLASLSRAALKAPGDAIEFHQFVPELGGVAKSQRRLLARETGPNGLQLMVEDTIDGMPGVIQLALDENGRWQTRSQQLPFGELAFAPATAELAARAAYARRRKLPDEAYESTMARSNIRLPDPRSLKQISLRIHHKKPAMGWPEFASADQRLRRLGDRFGRTDSDFGVSTPHRDRRAG